MSRDKDIKALTSGLSVADMLGVITQRLLAAGPDGEAVDRVTVLAFELLARLARESEGDLAAMARQHLHYLTRMVETELEYVELSGEKPLIVKPGEA